MLCRKKKSLKAYLCGKRCKRRRRWPSDEQKDEKVRSFLLARPSLRRRRRKNQPRPPFFFQPIPLTIFFCFAGKQLSLTRRIQGKKRQEHKHTQRTKRGKKKKNKANSSLFRSFLLLLSFLLDPLADILPGLCRGLDCAAELL